MRTGPVYDSAVQGGFAVLDEINMARNDAVSVLHAAWTLDGLWKCRDMTGSACMMLPGLSGQ